MNALYPVIAVIAAYLIGSLSFAVIVSRVMGLNDPRTYGSGNPGATNVLRSGSKAAAAVTLALDALKGLAFESPRGPIYIDAQTRDIVQDVYLRKVERVNGQLYNVEFDVIKDVKDPGKTK